MDARGKQTEREAKAVVADKRAEQEEEARLLRAALDRRRELAGCLQQSTASVRREARRLRALRAELARVEGGLAEVRALLSEAMAAETPAG